MCVHQYILVLQPIVTSFFIFFYTTLRINQKLLQQHKICFLFSSLFVAAKII